MYKTDFYISVMDRETKQPTFQRVDGWGETFEAPNGDIIEIRLDKRGGGWHITEATTGLAVTGDDFPSRPKAIADITPDLLQKIADILQEKRMKETAQRLADYIMTVTDEEPEPALSFVK